jgi:hypothetical protein
LNKVLELEIPGDPQKVARTVERILQIADPFEKTAHEELERFRSTFAELAK